LGSAASCKATAQMTQLQTANHSAAHGLRYASPVRLGPVEQLKENKKMNILRIIIAAVLVLISSAAAFGAEPKIVTDAHSAAEWMSKALTSSGYNADFSLNSLREVDLFFDEQTKDGKAKAGGLLSEKLGQRLFGIGAYVGEVIRRNAGGEWNGDDADPQAEINISLKLKSGGTIWPVQRAMKRLKNGKEDSIYEYGILVLEGK